MSCDVIVLRGQVALAKLKVLGADDRALALERYLDHSTVRHPSALMLSLISKLQEERAEHVKLAAKVCRDGQWRIFIGSLYH